ncbi:MAG: hypothetical protein Q8Q01_03650 [archaeon]|nr:hypothetical protein [archaeon]
MKKNDSIDDYCAQEVTVPCKLPNDIRFMLTTFGIYNLSLGLSLYDCIFKNNSGSLKFTPDGMQICYILAPVLIANGLRSFKDAIFPIKEMTIPKGESPEEIYFSRAVGVTATLFIGYLASVKCFLE